VPFKNAVPIEGASANAFAVLFGDTFFFSCHESLTLYACTKECSLEGVAGLLRFAGSVSALAYLGPKESISEAISDLKVVMEYLFPLLSFLPSHVFHDGALLFTYYPVPVCYKCLTGSVLG